MRFSAISSLLVGLFVSTTVTLAAPAVNSATPTVRTPHGMVPAANVHEVPAGGKVKIVGDEIHLLDADGTVIHVAQNDAKPIKKTTPVAAAVSPLETGWVAYADWYNNGAPITSFSTQWTVPPTPATNHGQTIFLFNSIEPASFDGILQPVLQWGGSAAGGGAYWALASWFLLGSNTYFTTPITTSSGTVLQGLMTLQSSSGSSYNYLSQFNGIGAGLEIDGSPLLVWATETLEVYGVTAISDYPAGSTVFSGIDLNTSSGVPSVSWGTTSDSADGVTATVNAQGATNAVVTIHY